MANRIVKKNERRARRKKSIRKSVFGTNDRPRLSVHRSAKHISAQIINDFDGRTVAASSTMSKDMREKVKFGGNADAAKLIGEDLAEKAKAAGVEAVVFDRNGYRFHGRIAALADAAREKGLKF